MVVCVPGEAMFAMKVSQLDARARSAVQRKTGPSRPRPGRGHESPLAYLRFTRVNSCFPGEAMFVLMALVRRRRRSGPSRARAPRVHPGEPVPPRGSNVRDKGVAPRGPRSFSRRARDRPEPPRPRTRTRIPPGIPEVHPGELVLPRGSNVRDKGAAPRGPRSFSRRARDRPEPPRPRTRTRIPPGIPEVHPGGPFCTRVQNVRDKDFSATSPAKRPIPRACTRSSPGVLE